MGTEGGRGQDVREHVRCSCCGRTRFLTELGIFTTDLSSDFDLADGTLMQTVLYCRDDSECRGTAQTLRLIRSAPVAGAGDLRASDGSRARAARLHPPRARPSAQHHTARRTGGPARSAVNPLTPNPPSPLGHNGTIAGAEKLPNTP